MPMLVHCLGRKTTPFLMSLVIKCRQDRMVCLCREGAVSPDRQSSSRGYLACSGGCASIVLNEFKYWESAAVTVMSTTYQMVQCHAFKI